MTEAEHKSELTLTKDTPYLTLTGELWGVCCDDFEEILSHCNCTTLYNGDNSADNSA